MTEEDKTMEENTLIFDNSKLKPLLIEDLNELSGYSRKKNTLTSSIKRSTNGCDFLSLITNLIPILKWLPKYSLKSDLPGDLIAGFTVFVMHIPQGMAYGLLAGATPSTGLYMGFFPILIYVIFGTSRHISLGTFAVISIMTSSIVYSLSTPAESLMTDSINGTLARSGDHYSNLEVATATTLMVGLLQIFMFTLRLGSLTALLSEPLVSAFTTGAAIHVVMSQMKDIFGIKLPRRTGAFKLVYAIVDICENIHKANWPTVAVSACIITFMIILNEIVKPRMAKICRMPLPVELFGVVGGTLASYFLNLGDYKVQLLGDIPVGLPEFQPPPFSLLKSVFVDSIAIAIVSYSVGMSLALMFAKKSRYEINANQELLALGLSNCFASNFSCIPLGISLSRTVLQHNSGGKTQFAGVIAGILVLLVILWIGPIFSILPKCILAGIIIVALKTMFTQIAQFKKFYEEGSMEALTWIVTLLGVALIDIDIGLLMGATVAIFAVYMKGFKTNSALLGRVGGTFCVFVDVEAHSKANEIPHTKIYRFYGAVNFASRSFYKHDLYKKIEFDKLKAEYVRSEDNKAQENGALVPINYVILDLSCINHMDMAGSRTLSEIQFELSSIGIEVILTTPADRVFDALHHATTMGEGPYRIYPSIEYAVMHITKSSDKINGIPNNST